jgi:hypothetical protein
MLMRPPIWRPTSCFRLLAVDCPWPDQTSVSPVLQRVRNPAYRPSGHEQSVSSERWKLEVSLDGKKGKVDAGWKADRGLHRGSNISRLGIEREETQNGLGPRVAIGV